MSHDPHDIGMGDADTGLSTFDDVDAHRKVLKDTMDQAHAIIAQCKNPGISKKDRELNKKQLPEIKGRLKQLLVAQLQKKGAIRQLDLADGSYDNVFVDDEIRKLLAKVRNLHTELNTLIGTRTIRKLTGFILEDIPNFFTVKWRQLLDNGKQLLKAGALYGGGATLAAVGGYSIATGDIVSGSQLLGQHLGVAGGAIGTTVGKIGTLLSGKSAGVSKIMGDVFHKISGALGGTI